MKIFRSILAMDKNISHAFSDYLDRWVKERYGTNRGAIKAAATDLSISASQLSNILAKRRNTNEEFRRSFASKIGISYSELCHRYIDNSIALNGSGDNNIQHHMDLFAKFTHKDWAKRISEFLLEIENDPVFRITTENVLKGIVSQIQEQKKTQKKKSSI